jgi:phosphoribosyl-ATP pyrophosphohydrolase
LFFDKVQNFDGENIEVQRLNGNPYYGILSELEDILNERKDRVLQGNLPERSYSSRLFVEGLTKITEKIREETEELIKASLDRKLGKVGEKNSVIWECADVIFHILVLLAELGVSFEDILQELLSRRREKAK